MNEERLKFAERFADVAKAIGFEGHGRQTRLAALYGKKQPSVKKWFDGEAQPDYEICVDMCRRAKVHYEWLMTGRGPRSISDDTTVGLTSNLALVYATPEELALLTSYREASELGKTSIRTAAQKAPKSQSLIGIAADN